MNADNRKNPAVFVAVSAVGLVLAFAVDPPVLRAVADVTVRENDAYRLFRVMGFLPGWLLVALGFGLVDAARAASVGVWRGLRRMWTLALGVVLSGAAGEVLKLLLRRQRPTAGDGVYHYIPWQGFSWSTSGFSLPSGHAIVAFGAAWALCRLHPRGWPVWLALATGCAVTRIVSHAHYVSDCFASAVVSFAVIWLVWRWMKPQPGTE